MDSVVFEGKEYTKASVLAEKFRYTQDYLGQLCRAKKVDARLVGRAWYINVDSLMIHRDGKYKVNVPSFEIPKKKAINNYLSRIDVEPILKQKTVKIFKSNNGKLSELSVKYEADDYALIPKIHREAVSVNLQVDQADAETVRVHQGNKEEINFKPEALPEVYLRGTLKVAGLAEPTEESIPKEKTVVPSLVKPLRPKIVTVRPIKRTLPPIPASSSTPTINAQVAAVKPSVEMMRPKVATHTSTKLTVSEVLPTVTTTATPQFRPAAVVEKEKQVTPVVEAAPSGIVIPVSMVLVALFFAVTIVATNIEILVSGTSYNARFVIQVANLASFYDRLPW